MTPQHLAEELELAEILPAGPVRQAWLEGVTWAGWGALSDAVRHAQLALASIRSHRYQDGLAALELAGASASVARAAVPLLEAESPAPPVDGQAILEAELGRVAAAAMARESTLRAASFTLGQLIGAHQLDRVEVVEALLAAAGRIGLTEDQAVSVIATGVSDGIRCTSAR